MARGRDHFSVGIREKNRERKREKKSNGEESHLRGALKLRSHESRASISMLR